MVTEEQIKQLAHTLWEQEGRPEGKDMHHYFTAKEMLEQREVAQGRPSAARPKAAKAPKARTHSSRAKKR